MHQRRLVNARVRRWNTLRLLSRLACTSLAIALFAPAMALSDEVPPAQAALADREVSFEGDVRPIFKAYCLGCHGAGKTLEGNLDLRLARFVQRGGDRGPAIVPGDPATSLLVVRVKAGEMPPTDKKLSAEQIAIIERWITLGGAANRDEPEQLPLGMDITPAERAYWAFQPITRPTPPEIHATGQPDATGSSGAETDRVRTPIDSFILARLHERGLHLAPEADRRTLIRRAAFDLTGLVPSESDLASFLADGSDNAYETMLDRLLQSPHYGERWARHWLDVAGYAESEGNGSDDTPRPYAYKFRDYVIRSLNADKPLDQFVLEQLAGDELVPKPWNNLTAEQIDLLAATGFLRMGPDGTATGGGEEGQLSNQALADALKIASSALLGLTVGCAQCHDHRYDPIPQTDYFRLRAVFEPAFDPAHWRRPGQRLVSLYTDADRARASAIDAEVQALSTEFEAKQTRYVANAFEKELLKLPEEVREAVRQAHDAPADQRTPEQTALLASHPSVNISPGVLYQYDEPADKELKADRARIDAKRAEKPVEDFVSVLDELGAQPPATHVFHRGDYRQPLEEVQPGDLTICAPEGQQVQLAGVQGLEHSSGRRTALARHWMSGRHPLVGRVLANRIWLHHFGRGLVATPGDFGVLGTRPTHPELLDWLADELAQSGFSLKRMHKLIMMSSVYRQSSLGSAESEMLDDDNRLYSRFALRRLEAELVRDRILDASGTLQRALFGPPVHAVQDFVGQVVVPDDVPRRGIYLEARRTSPVSLLAAFDSPVMAVNCDRRTPSTNAPQALMLMNSEFVLKHAVLLAQRVRQSLPADAALDTQLETAWRLVYQRGASPDELEAARRFIAEQVAFMRSENTEPDPDLAALANLCQQLLSSNEFLYVD